MLQGLDPVWTGVAEIALGLVFLVVGYSAARVVLALWGALVGFLAGTLLYVALLRWEQASFLVMVPWWVFSIGLALLVASLSFAFYTIGVLVSMGAVGWGVGQFVSSTLHLPSWISFAMGLVVAAGLVMVGWTINLPKAMLVVLTAVVGAAVIVDGAQAVLGRRLDWFDQVGWRTDLVTNTAWTAGFLLLAATGMFIQFRANSEDTLRDAYKRV